MPVIVFVISTFPLQHQRDSGVFFTMQAFAIASAAIRTPFCVFHPPRGRWFTFKKDLVYTAGLIILATLTVKAFDKDVWIRDIDNTPSPFPLPVVFAFIFPRLAPFFESTRPFIAPGGARNAMCLSGCTCGRKGCDPTVQGTLSQERLTEPVSSNISNITTRSEANILDESLIRVPNAAERRVCIFVNLDLQWMTRNVTCDCTRFVRAWFVINDERFGCLKCVLWLCLFIFLSLYYSSRCPSWSAHFIPYFRRQW